MKRTLLPMTLVGLIALSLSACSTTMNSAASRTASSPITGTASAQTERQVARAEQAASVIERRAASAEGTHVALPNRD